MRLNRDSLLIRIIFYNDIAIIVIASVLAFIFSILVFDGMERRITDRAREKNFILYKAYESEIHSSKDDLFNATASSLHFINIELLKNEKQYLVARTIRNQLQQESKEKYSNVHISILNASGALLAESYTSKELRAELISADTLNCDKEVLEKETYFFVSTPNNIYIRMIQPVRGYNEFSKRYIIMTLPITNYSKEVIRNFIELDKNEGFFILAEGNYAYGDFNIPKFETEHKEKFMKVLNSKQLMNDTIFDFKFSFAHRKIDKEEYLISVKSIKNRDGTNIGGVGIAISKSNFLAIKYMVATIILAVVFIAVIISTTLCSRLFANLLAPISKLANNAEKFGIDEYKIDIEEVGSYEIRSLINSIKTMCERIKNNDDVLKQNNNTLQKNLDRIIAIEKILMGIDIENNFDDGMRGLLKALTSEIGFGYSRAIYFEYDKENNILQGKNVEVNNYVLLNIDKEADAIKGFKFQIEDMENLLPLLKVNFQEPNILWESINKRKIIYHNDKGYRFDFGNDLFKAMGISNFMILPLADVGINVGCILIDYFGKDYKITKEEVEVMMLLLLNLNIRIKNRYTEEENIIKERMQTINKISKKFIDGQKEILPVLKDFIEKNKNNIYNNKDSQKTLVKLQNLIKNLESENIILDEMLKYSDLNFEPVKIGNIIKEVIADIEPTVKKYAIVVSLMLNSEAYIYGDKKKIYRMFAELIKNSIESIMIRNKLDKKINIVVTEQLNKRVIIEIIDNGIGMTKEEVESLRESYGSTMEGSILGFGLATVYKTVREHKGVINIASVLDEGTRVKIIFNVYEEENN